MTVNIFLVIQTLHTQICINSIVRVNVQQVLDSTALRVLCSFRYFIYLQPVTFTLLSKEHHRVVHCCRVDVLNKVFITGFSTLRAYSTAVLSTEFCQWCTFDISHVWDGDNHLIIRIKVFRIEFFWWINDFRTAFVTIFSSYFQQFVFDYFTAYFIIGQDTFQICYLLHNLLVFSMELILHQTC